MRSERRVDFKIIIIIMDMMTVLITLRGETGELNEGGGGGFFFLIGTRI